MHAEASTRQSGEPKVELRLRVAEAAEVAPQIRTFTLVACDGDALPAFEAGAHLNIHLPAGGCRSYSLISFGDDPCFSLYRIAVLLEEGGRGGSRYMHSLAVGAELQASRPVNHFRLLPSSQSPIFLAGGIGITPIIPMVAEMRRRAAPFELFYCARTRSRLAFLPELERLAGNAMTVHCDDEVSRLDLSRLFNRLIPGQPIYVCGPLGLIDATIATATARGWRRDDVHFELFAAPLAMSGDEAFEVELRQSGRLIAVPPSRTILDALIDAGLDPLHDCRRGDCGICQVAVLAGEPDHRDYFLSDAEKAANKSIQICISRAKSKRLVLDL